MIEQIGGYRVLKRIATGGMGTVYLAEQTGGLDFRKLVAVKVLHPHLKLGEEASKRFAVEARIGASLAHPNIVSVNDLAADETHGLYFVMEYVHGCSLRTLMVEQAGGFEAPLAATIVAGVLGALHAAHTFVGQDGVPWPVVHRDVNPKNVMLSTNGAIKLADFGIAKIFDQQITVASGLRGTIAYMSPEQADGQPLDARTDIYSCGVILYELLLGRRALEGTGEIERLKAAQRGVVIDEPALVALGVPGALIRLLHGALAHERDLRFPTAAAMLDELEGFLAWAGAPQPRALASLVEARSEPLDDDYTESVGRQTDSMTSGVEHPAAAPARDSRWLDRRLYLVGGGLLLAVVVALALTATGDEPRPTVTHADAAGPGRTAVRADAVRADVGPDVATSAADARPATRPAMRSRPRRRPRAAARRASGRLMFNTVPRWSAIWVDGKPRGETPVNLRLPAGRHRIVLRPLGRGKARRFIVTVHPGKTTRRVVSVD